jgi:ADP-ribosylglycohydrolase
MIGAIAGDMIGSPYERYPTKSKDIDATVSSFTDDTVLTIAVADLILNNTDCAEISKPSIRRDIPVVVQLPGKRTVLQF